MSWLENANVVIVGASGGIGNALAQHLALEPGVRHLFAGARREPKTPIDKSSLFFVDLEDETTIAEAASSIEVELDLVIVATGMLHDRERGIRPEKALKQARASALLTQFQVNAIGPLLVAKHFLPKIKRDSRAVFAALSARVGSIEDNRLGGWYGYRASKAALNQFIRTTAIEWRRTHKHLICVGLHPGTVDTELSQPFQSGVPEHKLFTADVSATRLLEVVRGLRPQDSGSVFAWDSTRIPG
ncbi:MAG: SDR family NAD(P)-dependent oxidoreductase [Myxococcota bacterium]